MINPADQLPKGVTPEMAAEMIPDEVRQLLEIEKERKLQQIQNIGTAIAKKRDEAVKARAGSGIEEEWLECEEAYLGIDDANRHENRSYKPLHPTGSFTTIKRDPARSTVYLNITRPYVDAAVARVADMLMPTDDRNYNIRPTPNPDLEQGVRDGIKQKVEQAFAQAQQQAQQPPQPGQPPQAPQPPAQIDQGEMILRLGQEVMEEAKKRAETAEKQIDDWLIQCQYHSELRKMLEDCGRLGVGIIKGPSPTRRKAVKTNADGSVEMVISIDPESRRVDPWNFFPDGACGDDIHNGSYVFELDKLSTKALRELKDQPGYLAEQIDKVIEEGPGKVRDKGLGRPGNVTSDEDEMFDVWYYYGLLDKDDLEALGVSIEEGAKLLGVPAIVTVVNDSVIKASLNPLDNGAYPFDVMPWQRRAGYWAGVGIAKQINTPQRIINAATRNMMDNAGISGGPILILRRGMIEPADGQWNLTPRKFFFVKEEAEVRNAADAITSIIVPSNQQEMSNIIQFALKMAEDVTGLPQLMQGSMGNQAPDTVGGMQMVMNNASTVLRRIARTFDDCVTEPHIRRYYDWLQMYGPDEAKGDCFIDARGSSALVERDIQNQSILQMGQLVMNPSFGIDPKKWFAEACKAQRLDPKKFQYTEEEQAKLAQQPPAPPPQVAVAQIREQGAMERKKMELAADQQSDQLEAKIDLERIKTDRDRDTIYVQAETERTRAENEARMNELMLKRELEMLKYANANKMTLDTLKADLAKESMRLNTQRELAGLRATADRMTTPPTEPPGRAPAGQSWQQ